MQTQGKNEGRPVNEALTNCLGKEKWLYSHIFFVNDISIKDSKHVLWQAMKPAMCYSPHDDEALPYYPFALAVKPSQAAT